MSAAAFVLGLLNVLLYCAIVIFVAFIFVWLLRYLGVSIDGEVYRWGKIIVVLLCVIAVVAWLLGALPSVPVLSGRWR